MSDNRPIVYYDPEPNLWVYRASSSWQCVRALVAAGLEYEESRHPKVESMLFRAAEEGNVHEEVERNKLIARGFSFTDTQPLIEIPIIKNQVIVRGHLDGVMESPDGVRMLWEAKSMSRKVFEEWDRWGFEKFPQYAAQITCYMKAYPGLPVLYTVKRRDDGLVDEFEIDTPPMDFLDIKKRILNAETYRRQSVLPGCDLTPKYACPFEYLHEEEILDFDNLDEETINDLAVLAEQHAMLGDVVKAGEAAKEERKGLGGELLEKLGPHKTVDTGDWKVSKVEYDRDYVDWTGVQKEASDEMEALILKHTKKNTVKYPKVTRKK